MMAARTPITCVNNRQASGWSTISSFVFFTVDESKLTVEYSYQIGQQSSIPTGTWTATVEAALCLKKTFEGFLDADRYPYLCNHGTFCL
jgi:hypothetical protein